MISNTSLRVKVYRPPKGSNYYLTPIWEGVATEILKEGKIDVADVKFVKFAGDLVTEFLETGKVPSASIQATVMNLAEDYTAGRDMVIRAGDYIALRQYQREQAK